MPRLNPDRSECSPFPVTVEVGEDIGGANVIETMTIQIRCGCRDDLRYDYGHEQDTP